MIPYYGWGSQEVLVLIWLTTKGSKTESNLNLLGGFEPETPELGIHYPNH